MVNSEGGSRLLGHIKKSSKSKPLVSIITVVFNGDQHLEKTIQSIINQTYDNVEYIIIDGGSTDRSIDIIKKYNSQIDYWVSEQDNGIGEAFNKGVKVAKGDYINFQGDGDGFITDNILERIFTNIDSNKNIFLSSRVQRVDIDGREMFVTKYVKNFNKKSLLLRMFPLLYGIISFAS